MAETGPDPHQLPISVGMFSRPKGHEHFSAKTIWRYDPDALYIGVENSSKASHHFYLVVRNKRYEIKLTVSFARIKDFGKDGVPVVTKGMLFELKIGPEAADELVKSMDEVFQADCLHAICRPLKKTGITFHDGKTPLRASAFDSPFSKGSFSAATAVRSRCGYSTKIERRSSTSYKVLAPRMPRSSRPGQ